MNHKGREVKPSPITSTWKSPEKAKLQNHDTQFENYFITVKFESLTGNRNLFECQVFLFKNPLPPKLEG